MCHCHLEGGHTETVYCTWVWFKDHPPKNVWMIATIWNQTSHLHKSMCFLWWTLNFKGHTEENRFGVLEYVSSQRQNLVHQQPPLDTNPTFRPFFPRHHNMTLPRAWEPPPVGYSHERSQWELLRPPSSRVWVVVYPIAQFVCTPKRGLLIRRNDTWSGSKRPQGWQTSRRYHVSSVHIPWHAGWVFGILVMDSTSHHPRSMVLKCDVIPMTTQLHKTSRRWIYNGK